MIFMIFCSCVIIIYATGLDSPSMAQPILSTTSCCGIAVYGAKYLKIYIFSVSRQSQNYYRHKWHIEKEKL